LFVNCDYRFFLNIEVLFVDYLKAYKSLRQKAAISIKIFLLWQGGTPWNESVKLLQYIIELAIITSET